MLRSELESKAAGHPPFGDGVRKKRIKRKKWVIGPGYFVISFNSWLQKERVMGYLESIERLKVSELKTPVIKKPWLEAWRELARLTGGMKADDARLAPVLAAFCLCDQAFYADDWVDFEQVASQIKAIMHDTKASRWARRDKKRIYHRSKAQWLMRLFPFHKGSTRTTKAKEDTHETIV
jgi:hypothetical protein